MNMQKALSKKRVYRKSEHADLNPTEEISEWEMIYKRIFQANLNLT